MVVRDNHLLIVHGIQDWTPEEARSHLVHLIYTSVCQYACSIARSKHQLGKGVIAPLSRLESMPTILRNFWHVTAQRAVETERFLVSDVLATLRSADHPDYELLHSVETFIAMDATATLDLVVTVEQRDGDYAIVDGNKRVVAFYESRRSGGSDATAPPIYIITPT